MAEKLTPQQERAVYNRGGKLLVSAAAGSGKTKVLVDRLLSYLMDPADPADLDQFLIITYTKAAASELRGKIAQKLNQRIAEMPESRHLQRQMQRLYLTKISTVHSFCADILREYAYAADIAADFRVADENECRQLRDSVMAKLLDSAYENIHTDSAFRAFVDTQGLGRDDRLVPEVLLKVYDSARCHLEPDAWLEKCLADGDTGELTGAEQTPWGEYLMKDLKDYLQLQIEAMEKCVAMAEAADGLGKVALLLKDNLWQLKQLAESTTWDEVVARKQIDYGVLRFPPKFADNELKSRIKAVRDACKKGLERRLKSFADTSRLLLEDMDGILDATRGMVDLVRRFGKEYDRAKKARRILDFGDLEHKMLDLLLGKSRSGPTSAAAEIGNRFREIMVDEYQDSNAVQDKIFAALTAKRNNCFMVGDVKQSIYQFRLADPKIFLQKYNEYAPEAEAADGEGRKVMLSRNFRSDGAVLSGVNDIFRLCMSDAVGGLVYGDDEALHDENIHTELGEANVELLAIPVSDSQYEEEANVVADRICELLDGSHKIRRGDALDAIRPEDIAILLRSPGSTGFYFQRALAERGIRCVSGGGDDLLKTEEISAMRAVLQTISNPRQDIPLLAAMTGPAFCFTADELAVIRSSHRKGSIYDAVAASEDEKCRRFLEDLRFLRRQARLQPLVELLELILSRTRLDSLYAAKAGGQSKRANLQAFYQLAADFEANGRRDLEQFLEHLEAMEEKGLIAAGEQSAAGAVTLMSIHKSKGLEFPVVFVSNLSKAFNKESARGQVLCDQDLGLGLSAVDTKNRLRYPTVAKRGISVKTLADGLSEEMRVLYVALTRPKDRLIMTYASGTLEKDIISLVSRMDMGIPQLLTQDASCPGDWVLMAALHRTEAGELFRLGGKPEQTQPGKYPWQIRVREAHGAGPVAVTEEKVTRGIPEEQLAQLKQGITFRYPHLAATAAPSKQTATQRKGREKDAEVSENAPERLPGPRTWRRAMFGNTGTSATEMGTATHTVMQYLDFENCGDEAAVEAQVRLLAKMGTLTPEQAKMVNCGWIARFFETELGKKLRGPGQLLREFKFSILDDGENYDPALVEEKILLQGVVDCALVEPDGITVVDFKTDYVTEDTVAARTEHYRPQVLAYADALRRIYGLPIKAAYLYYFRLGTSVMVK